MGFVVTFYPQGDHAPYQTVQDYRYMMRSGPNFAPVPHAVLAGMFGRRPQSRIIHNYVVPPPVVERDVVRWQFGLMLRNNGRRDGR